MSKSKFGFLTGIVVPVLLFLITPYWGAIFTENKALTYEVLEKKKLSELGADESVGSRLKMVFNGRDVKLGTYVVIAIENAGKAPVRAEDFYSDIVIKIEGGEIISAQLIETQPENIPLQMLQQKSSVSIKPMLLNPGDRFLLKMFSDSDLKIVGVQSRILGVSAIERVQSPESSGLVVKSLKPLDGGGVLEKKVQSLNILFVLFLSVVLLTGTFLNYIVYLRVVGWPRYLFLILSVSMYASALYITNLSTEYMLAVLGWGRLVTMGLHMAEILIVGGLFALGRRSLIQSIPRPNKDISTRTYRVG
ncbi:hypothetical protein [Pseudomonas sp. SMV7]|uniref:hypothetical protein n=1 Tax=Pseudomonas sp. SMV7 TaxID=3390194 RepID=UPI003F87154B